MLVIRLSRAGTKNKPFYHVIVSESTRKLRTRVTDRIGYYDPRRKPEEIKIDVARAETWIKRGAHPSETVAKLISLARAAQA